MDHLKMTRTHPRMVSPVLTNVGPSLLCHCKCSFCKDIGLLNDRVIVESAEYSHFPSKSVVSVRKVYRKERRVQEQYILKCAPSIE